MHALALALCLIAFEGQTITPVETVPALDQPEGKKTIFEARGGVAHLLIKRGGPKKAWCKIESEKKQQGWVRCDVRDLPDPGPADPIDRAVVPKATPKCKSTCDRAPLFAKPPALAQADREVLALCPTVPEASVSRNDIRRYFAAHYDDARIQRALSIAGRPASKEDNLDWLTDLWAGKGPRNAFTHVFCGDDWEKQKLGGLHFLPRYAELEAAGKLCFGGAVRERGDQYLIRYEGVSPWSCGEKKVGGFTKDHDPIVMIAAATRAFVECCTREGKRQGGVFAAGDLGPQRWQVFCGTRNGTYGIATIYPTDAKQTCGR